MSRKELIVAKGLFEIDLFQDAVNGKEEASHRNFGNGLCSCWRDCLVFQADFRSSNAMGSCRVDITQVEQKEEELLTTC